MVKPKEVSLDSPPKTALPKVELPKDENKLFDKDDEFGASTIPDLSMATPLKNVWDHAIDILFKLSTVHPDRKSLQMWVKYRNTDSMEQPFQWDKRQLAAGELSTCYLEVRWDKTTLEYLRTNPTRNLLMLWKYIHHLVMEAQTVSGDAFSILLPENFCKITWEEFMTWRHNNSTLRQGNMFPAGYRGPPKPDSNPNAPHLLNFKKSIKREVSQYTFLKDGKYFQALKRNLLVTASTHSCEEVLDAHYIPGHDADSQELFQQEQYFMCSVFNKVLQSDVGKVILRRHAPTFS